MKKIVYSALVLTGLFVASCAPDKNDDPASPTPDLDARDKYVAYWTAHENSALAGSNSYTVNIIKSTSNSNDIIINNFSGLAVSARATVNNSSFTIPYQQIGTIGFTKGSGTLTAANSILLSYTTTIGTSRDSSTATYTK
ncbi:MAG: hypothetical protein HY062_15100 [Bacteroidetes bacterium]|nr:hypothetical protein [Bacteroidota bacterium]